MYPIEKGMAKAHSISGKDWLLNCQGELILERAFHPLSSINRVGIIAALFTTPFPAFCRAHNVCLIKHCWWRNEWLSGNYFQYFKKLSGTSTFASIRLYMPNKIAHFFPFLLVLYQLSVLTLSTRHADQKLGLLSDDLTVLVTRTLDKCNTPKLNYYMDPWTNLRPK